MKRSSTSPNVYDIFEKMIKIEEIEKPYQATCVLCQRITKSCAFHLYSIWLFTFSDLKTIVFPSTIFGLFNGVAVALNDANTPSSHLHLPPPGRILSTMPLVVFWVWINLLPFAIDNQRQPESIQEDSLNKPWRVMPCQRLSSKAAKHLMLAFYVLAVFVSFYLETLPQCLTLILLGCWYNGHKLSRP